MRGLTNRARGHMTAAIVATGLAAGPASGQFDVSLQASADGAVQFSGSLGYTAIDSENSIQTSRSGGNNVRNGVYEFDLGAFPVDAIITSVTLELTTAAIISNTGSTAEVAIHAFAGDGAITDDDHQNLTAADAVASEVFATGGTGVPVGTTLAIAFDSVAALQDAIDHGATHLTVRSQTVNFVTFRVDSNEGAATPAQAPTLKVTYVPTPGTAAALACVGLIGSRRRR